MKRASLFAILGVFGAGVVAACGDSPSDSEFLPPTDSTLDGSTNGNDASSSDDPPIIVDDDGSTSTDNQPIVVEPADPVVTFTMGGTAPTVAFKAKTKDGTPVAAAFTIDRGEIGAIGTSNGVFTAAGIVGGKAKVTATSKGRTASTTVTVKLVMTENGSTETDAGGGAGGYGGVGGEGPGAEVTTDTVAVLKGTPQADPGLSALYPYDRTVWPRGILAPLLQWKPGAQGDYDAVRIELTEDGFSYDGTFAKTAAPFVHHPIPQQAWKLFLQSNGGEDAKVKLTFAKGGVAYGSLSWTWKIASAPLKGTVYYNSYGTTLVKNAGGAKGGDGKFGAATLAIKGGSTSPVAVAGTSGDASKCRVCHSVAADGSVLITQRSEAGDKRFSAYDLKTTTETVISPEGSSANFAWPAIYPDGSIFLGDSSPAPGSSSAQNGLFQVPKGGVVTPASIPSNWPSNFRAAFPSFSPDGKQIAFTMYAGATDADGKTIGTMTFDPAAAPNQFGAITKVFKPDNGHTALYPSFLPTSQGLVFEVETRFNSRDFGGTRSDGDSGDDLNRGARAELWWVDLKTQKTHRLDALNGRDAAGNPVIPSTSTNQHDDDTTLNYEPTVNPVPSGGYAWVVFTSRRLYGNVATINPFHSDPRNIDLVTSITPKKLWVAAIDLNAAPGTDPSHPAFYLPAQELYAGNARGYWVVDPCKSDNADCETGDECCGGYCRPNDAGKLVCTDHSPTCAQEFEKCTTTADCCAGTGLQCINGRCIQPGPN